METRKEKVIKVLSMQLFYKPRESEDKIYSDIADAILAIPLDIPSMKEIESHCNDTANPLSKSDFERGEWLGHKEGAVWAIEEIIKRNNQ